MKIAILTSGGDAPGMNACLRAITRAGIKEGCEMFAIYDGFKGLIEENIKPLTRSSVSDIINRGGTIIGTARLPSFSEPEVQRQAAQILRKFGIDALVALGGNGTFLGASALNKLGINCIGIPCTIDNDIQSTDYTIGFDTALNTIVECVDKLRDTSTSHQRCSVIEVMGRYCGDLAAYAGLACGSEITVTKEHLIPKSDIISSLIAQKAQGKRHAMIIIAEKICDVREFARDIEREVGFETKSEVLGHLQRGGCPSGADRVLAARLGVEAIRLLLSGQSGLVVGIRNNKITATPILEATEMPSKDNSDILAVGGKIE